MSALLTIQALQHLPFEINSWNWGPGVQATGHFSNGSVAIVKRVASGTPSFWGRDHALPHFPTAIIQSPQKPTPGEPIPYYHIVLTNVTVSHVQLGHGGDDAPTEIVTFEFGSATVSHGVPPRKTPLDENQGLTGRQATSSRKLRPPPI